MKSDPKKELPELKPREMRLVYPIDQLLDSSETLTLAIRGIGWASSVPLDFTKDFIRGVVSLKQVRSVLDMYINKLIISEERYMRDRVGNYLPALIKLNNAMTMAGADHVEFEIPAAKYTIPREDLL